MAKILTDPSGNSDVHFEVSSTANVSNSCEAFLSSKKLKRAWYTVRSGVSPDSATTACDGHMDKVKEETPDERGDEFRLAAIYGDVTWQSIRIISTILISYIAESF
ncbi:hypothetical protein Y032_0186g1076 [Ancylostoma ceylanicum]|uniref:Uncharacterized protein n=1 Tax=Ancylostoma ceylanicum TaxID=53326 RepID=A0A016SQZ7_9BILA|nr:hypothetical protein Y032_0186g1076 [Ancylostoma ceylanicum]